MKNKTAVKSKSSYSSFWLGDRFKYKSVLVDLDINGNPINGNNQKEETDILQLIEARDAVANFVRISTNKNDLAVNFVQRGNDSWTDGHNIQISANLDGSDFDIAVGLALHEAAHIIYTDFSEVQSYISSNITDNHSEFRTTWNIIEDFYIDAVTQLNSPGYVEYFNALYDEYFNSNDIAKAIRSENFSVPSWNSYLFHIGNIRNEHRDLTALPRLDDIFNIIDVKNISRLSTPKDRLDVAKQVFDIMSAEAQYVLDDQATYSGDVKRSIEDGNVGYITDDTEDGQSRINVKRDELSKSALERVKRKLEKQRDFFKGDVKKKKITRETANALSDIIKLGGNSVVVGGDPSYGFYDRNFTKKIRVLVLRKITDEMRRTGLLQEYGVNACDPFKHSIHKIDNAILNGKKLAKKLLIRNEDRITTTPRLKSGKLDRRLIHELGFDNYEIFSQLNVKQFKPVNIHISIDQSGSMAVGRLEESLAVAAMISTASLYINNLDVTVSLRGVTRSTRIPYIAYIFDSKLHDLNHIRHMFSSVTAHSETPEGLCFEAIQKEIRKDAISNDSYFINICDGLPAFSKYSKGWFRYKGRSAEAHCRDQMLRIERSGTHYTAYFIGASHNYNHAIESCYGGRVVYLRNSNEIELIADTINSKLMETLQ